MNFTIEHTQTSHLVKCHIPHIVAWVVLKQSSNALCHISWTSGTRGSYKTELKGDFSMSLHILPPFLPLDEIEAIFGYQMTGLIKWNGREYNPPGIVPSYFWMT